MTPEIKRKCRKKKRVWDAGRHDRNSHYWKRYLKLSKLVKNTIQESHRTYVDNILNVNINNNPKKFYSYMKQKKSGQSNIPVLKSDGNLLSEPAEVAEALNSQYTSQFTREPDDPLPYINGQPVPSMPDIEFTAPGIEKLLNNLNPAKASGPDMAPARILKLASKELAQVLSLIYQQSYDTGQVPSDWQKENITAVFRKGDKTNPANYRPVSLTCIVYKSMEHTIYSQIMNHLDRHNILVEFQHGFRANHSCETQLLNTVEDLSRILDLKTTDLLILDFRKAFDTVAHRRLLHKIQHYGVAGKTRRNISIGIPLNLFS